MPAPPRNPSQPDKRQLILLFRQALAMNAPLDRVEAKLERLLERNDVTQRVERHHDQVTIKRLQDRLPKSVRYGALVLPVGFIGLGLLLVGNAALPIGRSYWRQAVTGPSQLTLPVPRSALQTGNRLVLGQTISSSRPAASQTEPAGQSTGPEVITQDLDYTNLANWFGGLELPELASDQPDAASQTYVLEIPDLDINRAEVVVGGTDLNNSLIQYPGTADPGQSGAPVIFGHSTLRQFYNPDRSNPQRYISVFSTIMTLDNGAEIKVTKDGVTYRYQVVDKFEVQPEDVFILTQSYDQEQLKLVTCVPEGTYLRRGVVVANLVRET